MTLSLWHWSILFLSGVLFVVPFWRIVTKAGFAGPWALLALVPVVNVLALWVLAFVPWPSARHRDGHGR